MTELKPCPFCGGYPRISYKWLNERIRTIAPPLEVMESEGIDAWCNKHITIPEYTYRVRAICNRCHAQGKPTTAIVYHYTPYGKNGESVKAYEPFVQKAIESWNRRVNE